MAEQEEKARGKHTADQDDKKDRKSKKADKEPKDKGVDVGDTVNKVRNLVATAVWILAVLAAVVLALGALVIVLDFNKSNDVVSFFRETADSVNFLGRLKDFSGKDALVKEALVNWGICAVVYLVVGKLLERVIRP